MKIYTKTGDRGTTSLIGGRRVAKNHPRIEAYGSVDELTAQTAYLRDSMEQQSIDLSSEREDLLRILDHLMRIGSHLACDGESSKIPSLDPAIITFLEERINQMDEHLEPVRSFTLPGGHPLVSLAHMARTTCRRCERLVVALNEQEPLQPEIQQYINRLSDYFYMLGRDISQKLNIKEILWVYDK